MNRNEIEETTRLMRQIAAHRERADRLLLAWTSARRRAGRHLLVIADLVAERDEARRDRDAWETAANDLNRDYTTVAQDLLATRTERDEARDQVVVLGRELEQWKLAFGEDGLKQATGRLMEALDRCKRPWTEDERHVDADGRACTTVTLKRCCNGCGERLDDVTDEEYEAGAAGRPLPDVRGECMTCTPLGGELTDEQVEERIERIKQDAAGRIQARELRAALNEARIEPRPSEHKTFTKSYAIDQLNDMESLRAVAHRMWEAFFAAHSQAAHAIGALVLGDCDRCKQSITDADGEPCENWQAWQRLVTAGFGSV